MLLWILLWLILGTASGLIAQSKGRGFWEWFFYGLLLAIVSIPWAISLKPDRGSIDSRTMDREGLKKCEHCAELIRADARVCRYCGRDVAVLAPPRKLEIGEGQY